ncbi:hypothetical protein BGZ61DRAFT_480614 [Ilyonectria robusta]|uniref:uncharacterized protein n=1 Tax=Ilyonectria robusta TaxID=1079257 RepID=UPI001E8CBD94|nr:uncharacterized protein BGZ61DRAFT_480614 [Ilyonectria robusta]KAH8683579.1 hypothetical protein BGZ61DRAFT_480614 [Ilyonectria robusta]
MAGFSPKDGILHDSNVESRTNGGNTPVTSSPPHGRHAQKAVKIGIGYREGQIIGSESPTEMWKDYVSDPGFRSVDVTGEICLPGVWGTGYRLRVGRNQSMGVPYRLSRLTQGKSIEDRPKEASAFRCKASSRIMNGTPTFSMFSLVHRRRLFGPYQCIWHRHRISLSNCWHIELTRSNLISRQDANGRATWRLLSLTYA